MFQISTYFSLAYLVLLGITVVLCAVLPKNFRRLTLLFSSWLFFFSVSGKLMIYLILTIATVFNTAIWLSNVQKEQDAAAKDLDRETKKLIKAKYQRKQRGILALCGGINIALLLMLKYSPFAATNINTLLRLMGASYQIRVPSFIIPIGISFYTLQAVAYLFDVYRKKIQADPNPIRFALFMSFFPQIMEGPICRYSDTAYELWNLERVRFENLILGGERIIFGFMKKMVVADRLNMFINEVFTHYFLYDGFVNALAMVCYTLQLYMDFSGTMDVVIGSAQIFGIKLPENFQRPFFSVTISEFWKRWHITLGTWFKDYIFYPVTMSKPMKHMTSKARKKLGNHYGPLIAGGVSLFCVWICNGIWHGAGWHYIFFGMYHFALILGGNMLEPLAIKTAARLKINRKSLPYRVMQMARTTVLVCLGELFFRAHGLRAGLVMFKKIFTEFSLATLMDGSLFTLGMDIFDYYIIIVSVIVIFVISLLQEKGINLRQSLQKKNLAVQFTAVYALIMFIVIFGAYGQGYIPVDPIYAGF